jgi:hypothetical protein
MTSHADSHVLGSSVLDARGERIGRVVATYTGPGSADPAFAGVKVSGFLRRRVVFVSLLGATIKRSSVTVKCGKKRATSAPATGSDAVVAGEDAVALYAHYELPCPADGTVRRIETS